MRKRRSRRKLSDRDRGLLVDARRVVVIGPPGSGKTWLAGRVGEARGWPVHHFDDVGHLAGGGSPLRDAATLRAFTERLATDPAWVCEGVDVDWTGPALAQADLIVWLDQGGIGPAMRLVQRFVRQAVAEARRQRGRQRFLRFRDYARRLRELAATLFGAARYARSADGPAAPETRTALAAALEPHASKVIRVGSGDERRQVVGMLLGRTA